jgi:hypothetical protein
MNGSEYIMKIKSLDVKLKKQNLFVLLITAGTAMWNMGVAFLAGLLAYCSLQKRWIHI